MPSSAAPRNGRPSTASSRPPGVPRAGRSCSPVRPASASPRWCSQRSTPQPGSGPCASPGWSRRWHWDTPASISWCCRSSTVRRLPEPQREAMDAVLGRTQHGPIDLFLVGLAVLSLVADAATAQPSSSSSTTPSGSTTSPRWRCRSSAPPRAERLAMVVALRDDQTRRFASNTSAGSTSSGSATRRPSNCWRGQRAPVDPTVASRIVAAAGQPPGPRRAACRVDRRAASRAAPLPDPLPIGDRLSDLFASRVRVLDADARMVLLLAAAERSAIPCSCVAPPRRPASCHGTRRSRGGGERSGHLRPDGRVPPSPRALCGVLLGPPRPIGAARMPPSPARSTPTPTPTVVPGTSAAAAGPDERVAQALEASAERARRRGGASAAAYLWRAFELTRAGTRPSAFWRRLGPSSSPVTVRSLGTPRARQGAGLGSDHDADAAWTEALVHIVAGDVREPAALLARALRGSGSVTPSWRWGPASPPTPCCSPADTSSTGRHGARSQTLAVMDRCEVRSHSRSWSAVSLPV